MFSLICGECWLTDDKCVCIECVCVRLSCCWFFLLKSFRNWVWQWRQGREVKLRFSSLRVMCAGCWAVQEATEGICGAACAPKAGGSHWRGPGSSQAVPHHKHSPSERLNKRPLIGNIALNTKAGSWISHAETPRAGQLCSAPAPARHFSDHFGKKNEV